jgi:hypothetical protein
MQQLELLLSGQLGASGAGAAACTVGEKGEASPINLVLVE